MYRAEIARALNAAENEGWPSSQRWKEAAVESQTAQDESPNDVMVRYGITRVTVDYFHYRNFRYTNAQDAITQARLEEDFRARSGENAYCTDSGK